MATLLYVRTCRTLWSEANKLELGDGNSATRSEDQRKRAKELTKRRRSVKMMIVCVTVFFACYATASTLDFIVLM